MVEDAISRGQAAGDREQISDSELLRRYTEENSEAAFAELTQRHIDLVFSAALRRLNGDAHAAADITQQVFSALARQAESLTRCAVLPGWLYATTRNVAVDFIRAEKRRRTREQEAHAMQQLHASPASPEWARLRPTLDAAMDELGSTDREAVLLRFFARRPFAEIGATLKLSEDAARMRVERAIEKLRAALARRGVTSIAALAAALETQAVIAAPAGLSASVASAACASAAAPSGMVGAFAQLMANTKLLLGGAGLLACFVGAFAVREVSARRDAEAAFAVARGEFAAQAAQAQVFAARVVEAEREVAEIAMQLEKRRVETTLAASTAATAATAPRSTASSPPPSPRKQGDALLARHPEVKRALDAWADAQLDGKWSAFYRDRGLTAEQIEEFRFLVRGVLFVPEPEPDGSLLELATGAMLSNGAMELRLRALLGDDGYTAYQQRVETKAARGAAGEVAGALALSDAPLTPAQYTQLIVMLQLHRVPEKTADTAPGRFDWAAVTREATSMLAPRQLAALDSVRAQDVFQVLWNRAPSPLDAAHQAANPGK